MKDTCANQYLVKRQKPFILSEKNIYKSQRVSQLFFYLPTLQRLPVYPGIQLHTYPFTRSVQVPFIQGELEHSLISSKEKRYFIENMYVK